VSKSKAYSVCVSLLLQKPPKVEEVRIGKRTYYRVCRDK
jgi:hypothetical protein